MKLHVMPCKSLYKAGIKKIMSSFVSYAFMDIFILVSMFQEHVSIACHLKPYFRNMIAELVSQQRAFIIIISYVSGTC